MTASKMPGVRLVVECQTHGLVVAPAHLADKSEFLLFDQLISVPDLHPSDQIVGYADGDPIQLIVS